jgi:hypothetical protein
METGAPMAASADEALTAVGTEFVLATPDGRTLRSADLVGATLNIAANGKQVEITIGSVEEESGDPSCCIILLSRTKPADRSTCARPTRTAAVSAFRALTGTAALT